VIHEKAKGAIIMWTLIGIALVVLAGFAVFVLQVDARNESRDHHRPAGQFNDPGAFN